MISNFTWNHYIEASTCSVFLKYCKSMQEEHTRYLWMKELYSQCCIIILQYCQHMVNILKTWCMLNICCLYVWISLTLNICLKHMFLHVSNICLNYVCENICLTYEKHMLNIWPSNYMFNLCCNLAV